MGLDEAIVDGVLSETAEILDDCLPLCIRRLKDKYGLGSLFKTFVAPPLEVWDKKERVHCNRSR